VQIHPSLYNNKSHSKHATPIKHHVVSPSTPRETNGTYWGYTVRIAESIQSTWKECPFEDTKYRTIGTTFQGMAYHHLDDFTTLLHHGRDVQPGDNSSTPPLNHYLIVFGGMGGIEETVEADESVPVNRNECHKLFDLWVNTFPWFGTKSVRIEEAVWISLARLRPLLFPSSHTSLATTNDVKERKGNNQDSHHSTRIMMESITSESEISDESSV
jgi:predicted SPOUT superfamily RNA methylase MTH1